MTQKQRAYNKVKVSNLSVLRNAIHWEDFMCMSLASLDICIRTHTAWKVELSSSVTHQYVQQCMRICWPAGMSVCTLRLCVVECLCVWVCTQSKREGREAGGVSCSIWSLTCCGALLRPPCLEVSSAGIGRLHASSIRGSILLLPCRLLSWGLLNWA